MASFRWECPHLLDGNWRSACQVTSIRPFAESRPIRGNSPPARASVEVRCTPGPLAGQSTADSPGSSLIDCRTLDSRKCSTSATPHPMTNRDRMSPRCVSDAATAASSWFRTRYFPLGHLTFLDRHLLRCRSSRCSGWMSWSSTAMDRKWPGHRVLAI